MANLTKTVNYFDDGTTLEYDAAPVVSGNPTEVDLTAGQTVTIKAV